MRGPIATKPSMIQHGHASECAEQPAASRLRPRRGQDFACGEMGRRESPRWPPPGHARRRRGRKREVPAVASSCSARRAKRDGALDSSLEPRPRNDFDMTIGYVPRYRRAQALSPLPDHRRQLQCHRGIISCDYRNPAMGDDLLRRQSPPRSSTSFTTMPHRSPAPADASRHRPAR